MDKISDGDQRSTEMVWIKTEPTDIKSTAYFCIKSESGNTVVVPSLTPIVTSTIDTESEVSIKSEITLGDFECIPSSDVLQLSNNETEVDVERKSVVRKSGLQVHQRTLKKVYNCNECGKELFKKTDLSRHLRSHTGEKPFACDECGMKFSQKCYIKPHKLIHTGEKPFACDKCNAKFTQNSSLKLHMKSQHTLVDCNECGEFIQKSHMKSHKLTHTVDSEVEKPFACDECGKKFAKKNYLRLHLLSHTTEKPFHCDECEQKFTQKSHLKSHKLTHSGEKRFICAECGAKFLRKSTLKQHVTLHTEEIVDRANNRNFDWMHVAPFECDECGAKFDKKPSLKKHLWRHFGEKLFVCDECGKTFFESQSLVIHLRSHSGEKPFACDECGMKFAQKYLIKDHKRTHTDEKPFVCDVCGVRFRQRAYLKFHKRRHTGEKPFSCDECEMRFATRSQKISHKLTHTGEKPFACDDCGMKFARKKQIKPHKLQHTGEKPFACDECEMRFTRKFYLNSHKLKHTGEKPFPCDECDKRFNTKSHLNQHKRVHNRITEPEKMRGNVKNEFGEISSYLQSMSNAHVKSFLGTSNNELTGDGCRSNVDVKFDLGMDPGGNIDEKPFACDESGIKFAEQNQGTVLIQPQCVENSFSCNAFEAQFEEALDIEMQQQMNSGHQRPKTNKRNVRPRSVCKPIPCDDKKPFSCADIGKAEKNCDTRLIQSQKNAEKSLSANAFEAQFVESLVMQQQGSGDQKSKKCKRNVRPRSVHKPIPCADEKSIICDKIEIKFTEKNEDTELTQPPRPVNSFSCDECEATFITKEPFQRHKRTHKDKNRFVCDECGKGFSRKDYLNKHKYLHTGVKPFSCDVCELRFAQKSHVIVHMRTHTGEKQFFCDECPSKFARNWQLKQHKQYSHRKKIGN